MRTGRSRLLDIVVPVEARLRKAMANDSQVRSGPGDVLTSKVFRTLQRSRRGHDPYHILDLLRGGLPPR